MSFCIRCGAQVNGKFCPSCGTPLGEAGPPSGQPAAAPPPPPAITPSTPVAGAPAVPKKRGPLFYGLIGCGALLGIILIVVVAAGVFVAHKAKQAGFDPELAKRNPTLAAAKMMVAVNPELELVSSDDSRGTVTIREKKTGKTMTVNLEDIKRGRIVFEGDAGERVEFQGEGGGLPAWIPAYPGAKIQGGINAGSNEGEGGTITLKTGDSIERVAAFYEDKLKSAGFEFEKNIEGSGGTLTANDSSGNRNIHGMLSTESGQTVLTLTYEKK